MSIHEITKEMKAAKAIKSGILSMTDDSVAIRDTLEGETNLQEMIRDLLVSIEEDQLLIDGTKSRLSELRSRGARFKKRIATKRAILQQAMDIAEMMRVETDVATVSLRSTPQSLSIVDESLIPSEFFEPQPPKINKKMILDALKSKMTVPGAMLSNGGQSISLRRI